MISWTNEFITELVANIDEPKNVMERHGVSVSDMKLWRDDQQFRSAYLEIKKFWDSNTNARDRIVQKSLAALEDSLLSLFAIANDSNGGSSARLDAIAKIAKLARADGGERANVAESGGLGGPAVKISINLGAGVAPIERVIAAEAIVSTQTDTVSLQEAITDE